MKVTHIRRSVDLRKKRVAAYCRVSTTMEAQEDSFELQKRYYERFIKNNPEWEFIGIYADEKSGTSSKNRAGFNKMLEDARVGKIDLILCKSISRFARNIVDSETAIRKLKGYGTYVEFERECINTGDPSCGMMLAILSAIAQDESRSISENIKWANRERVKRGEYNYGNNRVLGYDWKGGRLVPNEDSQTVKLIFDMFKRGEGFGNIIKKLDELQLVGLQGKSIHQHAMLYILTNPIYVGDMELQKKPPINFLTKKPDFNEAYESNYLTNDHEPIVDRETWDAVQKRISEREQGLSKGIRYRSDVSFLSGRIICQDCGQVFVRRTSMRKGPNGTYSVPSWVCKSKRHKETSKCCHSHILTEEYILERLSIQTGLDFKNDDQAEEKFMQLYSKVEIDNRDVKAA